MKLLASTILAIFMCCWLINATYHIQEPNPVKFWDNYGFAVGNVYTKTPTDQNPFEKIRQPDTLIVKSIKEGYVQFTDGNVERIGSLGMGLYDWNLLK